MSDIQLDCPIDGCIWKSQSLPPTLGAALNTALQAHVQAVHPPTPQQAPPTLKLKAPSISAGTTPDHWSAFQKQWSMYKTGMAIPAAMCSTALFHCCEEELINDLMRDLQACSVFQF